MVNDVAPPRKTPLLCHVTDPEDKRRIIGDTFMRVANEVIEDLSLNPDEVILGQGKVQWAVRTTHQVKSPSGSCNEI
jgi:GMP synthase PP-ATPase subunit